MSRELPPFQRSPRPGSSEPAFPARKHYNPLLIFGIPVFAMVAFYLMLVMVTQAAPILFPGNGPNVGLLNVLPGVKSDSAPDYVTINDRINIVVMGLDVRRDDPPDTPGRTDTLFVLTIDPYSKTAGIFNIPRDTLVEIPNGRGGYFKDRVNVAYETGEYLTKGYPGGGFGLLKDTLMHNFGIPVDNYVILNFNNFISLIDEIGGIDINVPEDVYDPAYNDCNRCPYYPVSFQAGPQHMDGQTALAYARLRHSDNDFKRIQRQQLVIAATAKKASDIGVLLGGNPLKLYQKYKDSVKTDLSDFKIPGLAALALQVGVDNINMVSMAPATSPCLTGCGGAAVLLWDKNKMEELKASVFSDGRLQNEHAVVEVLNGTETPNLASGFASFLRKQGLPAERITADEYANGQLQADTVIYDLSGKSYTVNKLAEWLNLDSKRIHQASDPAVQQFKASSTVPADIVVMLGADVHLPDNVASASSDSGSQTATTGG